MRSATRTAWLATAAALLGVCSCGGAESSSTPDPTGIVRASWSDPQNPMEPANTNEVQGGKVLDMIFRGLKHYDPSTGEARNMLAQSITTRDQRTFKVRIKPGRRFSDGTPVTARSFVDAWNYGALLTNHQVLAPFFQYIEGYDRVHPAGGRPTARTLSGLHVVDSRTFTVRLTQKFSFWPQTLGYPAYAPLPRAFFTHHAAWLKRPFGDGPYRVASYTRGKAIKLRRDNRYPGPDRARNGGVDLMVYTDNNTAYTDLQAGNLDVVDDIPAAQLPNVRADLGKRYLNKPAGILQTVSFPMYRTDTWGSPRAVKLRRGLSMAIDRKQITRTIYHSTRTPAGDWTSPVLRAAGGYRKGVCGEACEYHPAQARKLIREAGGLPGGRVTITSNVDSGSHRQWMEAVCNSINHVLKRDRACTVNPVPTFAEYRRQITGRQMNGMFRTGWQMDYPLIQDFLQPLYYTGASSNDSGYSSKGFDRPVDAANAAADPARAVDGFLAAERVLAKDFPSIPLWYQNGNAGYSPRVTGVALDQFSVPVFTGIRVNR